MQTLNLILFSAINAGVAPQPGVARLAIFAADWLVYALPAMLLLTWIFGARPTRRQAIEAGLGVCVALSLAQVIGHFWFSPRPFMAGVGTQLIPHAPDSSFPSDHMTFAWSMAVGLMLGGTTRFTGVVMAAMAAAIAWGRIYAGVHWPFDMAGGVLVGTAGALTAHLYEQRVTAVLGTARRFGACRSDGPPARAVSGRRSGRTLSAGCLGRFGRCGRATSRIVQFRVSAGCCAASRSSALSFRIAHIATNSASTTAARPQ